jgi:hypothetical protein
MAAVAADGPPTAETSPDLDQARAHVLALHRAGDVREVRVLEHVPASGYGGPATVSGYFDNAEALVNALEGIGADHAAGVYITQNPVDPDLLARANNRLKRKPKQTTADADIFRLAHITFDLDPVRKAGISATDAELAAALAQRDALIRFLTGELGWPEPVVRLMSGNGGQATWRVDLPVASAGLIGDALAAAHGLFGTAAVAVDTTLGNPARLVKLAGTRAGKGDPLPHRPHRRAHGTFQPETATVTEAQLLALVALAPAAEPAPGPVTGGRVLRAGGEPYDVAALLRASGVDFTERDRTWGRVYALDRCLSSDDHCDGAAIFQFSSGAVAYRCHHNTCAQARWPDVKAKLGIPVAQNGHRSGAGARERATADGLGGPHRAGAGPRDWPDMAPLPDPTPSAPTLPAAMVPDPLRPWIVDIADRCKLPLEMVAAPAIVATATPIGRAVGLRPGEYDDFTVVAALWGALVTRPGWMKSGAVKDAFRPLGRLAAAAHEAHEAAEDANAVTRERIEAELKAIKAAMEKAAKDGGDMTGLETALRAKRAELREATATERRYLTHDPTVEKLGMLLRDNPRGMLLLRDELAGWLRSLDKSGREGDREFYLEAWNGTGSYTSDRIGRGTIHIPALTLSLFGGIQPGKLGPLLASAVEGGIGDDGLIQRLQMTVWPDRLPPWTKPTRWPDAGARERADAVFDVLAAMDAETVKATDAAIPFLRYSPAAQAVADTWRDALERRLRSDDLDDTPAFAAHLAKYRSLAPTLALVFYLIDVAARTPGVAKGAVGEGHIRLAADWCGFLEAHARKLYAAELHAGGAAAHALAAKIKAGAVYDGQSVRELYRAQWAGLKSAERVLAGLGDLGDRGWLRVEFATSGGRPSQIVRLHPGLVERAQSSSAGSDGADARGDADDA